jgi:hypothetical protein
MYIKSKNFSRNRNNTELGTGTLKAITSPEIESTQN